MIGLPSFYLVYCSNQVSSKQVSPIYRTEVSADVQVKFIIYCLIVSKMDFGVFYLLEVVRLFEVIVRYLYYWICLT